MQGKQSTDGRQTGISKSEAADQVHTRERGGEEKGSLWILKVTKHNENRGQQMVGTLKNQKPCKNDKKWSRSNSEGPVVY